jgi:hypothetical protein
MAGELGGIFTLLRVLFTAIVMWGGQANIFTLITNALYKHEKLTKPEEELLDKDPEEFWRGRVFEEKRLDSEGNEK